MSILSKVVLVIFNCFFLLSTFTIERRYCHFALTEDDPTLLAKQTYEFSVENNPLFLERPEWLRVATCFHSYAFPPYYVAVLLTTLFDAWHVKVLQYFLLAFVGAKFYALAFYHYMEFTSHVPPPNVVAYFSAEGSYIIALAMVLTNIWRASSSKSSKQKQR